VVSSLQVFECNLVIFIISGDILVVCFFISQRFTCYPTCLFVIIMIIGLQCKVDIFGNDSNKS
jgi:hypothetical protein